VSIAANIAEGSSRFSDRYNLRFVEISYGSLMEVLSHIEIATRQSLISMEHREQVRTLGDQLARQLSGFANHLRKQQS
jgi:four helix bundle protein